MINKVTITFSVVLSLLFIASNNSYSQDSKLFDNNCLNLAKTNSYVRGNSKSLNDSTKRTERWFSWDKISEDYSDIVKDKSLDQFSKNRYNNFDPKNPPDSLLTCKDSPENLDKCTAFKAYCTENIAVNGIKEELNEWSDIVKNCSRSAYVAKFPEHCQRDFDKSLNYLNYHAINLAKINKSKSPEVALFFKEAASTFSEYSNDLKLLMEEYKKNQNSIKDKKEMDQKRLKTADAMKRCNDLVLEDEHDVKNRNISLNILSGMSCANRLDLTGTEKDIANDLSVELEKVNKFSSVNIIAPKLNVLAIKKSSKALWATYETFFNQDKLKLNKNEHSQEAINLICDQKNKYPRVKTSVDLKSLCTSKFKNVLKESFNEYLELKSTNPVKVVTQENLQRDLDDHFNPTVEAINKSCLEAKDQFKKDEFTYNCTPINTDLNKYFKNSKIKAPKRAALPKDLELIYNDGTKMDVNKCDRVLDAKYRQHRKTQSKVYSMATPAYNDIVQSRVGHLMITDKFQSKVGLASNDWVYNKCLKGNGKAFGKVSIQDVNRGLKDVLDLNFKELSDNAVEMNSAGNNYDRVKEYLKNNPLTVADLLDKNPEDDYAFALCTFIRDINLSDYRKQWVDRGTMAVGVVAGVALSMTGVGSPAGVALIGAVGAATTVEYLSIKEDIKSEKSDIKALKQAAVTFQTDFNSALSSVNAKKANIDNLNTSKNLVVVFGALDVLGSGGFRLMKNFLKTGRGVRAGRILGVTANALTQSSSIKLAKQLSVNIEKVLSRSSKPLRKILKGLEHDEMLEFSAIYSKLDDSKKADFLQAMSDIENKSDLLKVLNFVSDDLDNMFVGKYLDSDKIIAFVDDLKKLKLSDGTSLEDIIPALKDETLLSTPIAVNASDVTLQNGGKIQSSKFFQNNAQKFNKVISKDEDILSLYDDLSISPGQREVLYNHLQFSDPAINKKMVNILSDTGNVKSTFLNRLKSSGCVNKVYDNKCRELVEKIINESASKNFKDHKLYKEWLLNQSEDIQEIFSSANVTGTDLFLASKKLPKEIVVKNIEHAKEYVDYLSTVSGKNKIKGYKNIGLIVEGNKPLKDPIYKNFTKRKRIFDNYGKYYTSIASNNTPRLRKIALSRGIKPTKENLEAIAKEESKRLKTEFVTKFNNCKAGGSKGVQAKNLQRFLKFNTTSSLAFTIGSYMWIMGSDDKTEIKIDDQGNLIEGQADKDYQSLVAVLGYELVASYVFSKIPGLVLGSPGSSVALNSVKDYASGGALDFVNTRIYGSLFGVNESESKKKIKELLSDPSKRAAMDQLQKYVDRKMKSEKMKKVVSNLQNDFSLFTQDLKSEDDIGYDYLMDNFSSSELASSAELMTSFEDSLNEYEYDKNAGNFPLSKYISELSGGATKVSTANDLFYYNLAYNIPSSVKRIYMYNLISSRLCMGRWGEVIAYTAIDKFLSNALYWGGRKATVGSVSN